MEQDDNLKIFEKIFRTTNIKWENLTKQLREAAEPDDTNQIFIENFEYVLTKFHIELT